MKLVILSVDFDIYLYLSIKYLVKERKIQPSSRNLS